MNFKAYMLYGERVMASKLTEENLRQAAELTKGEVTIRHNVFASYSDQNTLSIPGIMQDLRVGDWLIRHPYGRFSYMQDHEMDQNATSI